MLYILMCKNYVIKKEKDYRLIVIYFSTWKEVFFLLRERKVGRKEGRGGVGRMER